MEGVNFNEWEKLDLRVGKIDEVKDIEGADLLYELIVDFGEEIGKRTICAGLKKYYSKEELKGKKAVFLVNLQPKKLRGIESQGMILAAVSQQEDNKEITLIVPEKDVKEGTKIS